MNAYKIVPNPDIELGRGKFYTIIKLIWFVCGLGVAFELKFYMTGVWVKPWAIIGFGLLSIFLLSYRAKEKRNGITKENHIKLINAFENSKINNMVDLESATGLNREVITTLIMLYWENGWIISTSDISLDDFTVQLEDFINQGESEA